MNSFEKLQCPRCASNVIEIKYAVDGRIETHLYTCKKCGAWRESYGIKQKKPVIPKENRSIIYPDNILNANRQIQSI